MSIDVERPLLAETGAPDMEAGIIVTVPRRHIKEFMELIYRGVNLWPDASNEIKIFADIVTEGKVMQEYNRHYQPMSTNPRGNQ